MPIGIRDVLLGVAIAIAVASLSYSIADHIETEKHVTQLEDIVIGDTSKPVGQGGGLIDQSALAATGIDAVKTTADDAAAEASSASSEVDFLSFRVEQLFTMLCEHLASHTKYDATPIYPTIGESSFCKEYLE